LNPQILLLSAAQDGRLFGLDTQMFIQIGIQLINAIVLFLLLSWLLYKPVLKFLKARSDKIAGELKQAADDMEKADGLKLQYEQKLKDIAVEKDAIIEAARKKAAEKAAQILAEAKTEADEIKARAAEQAEAELKRVEESVKNTIIEVSTAMSEKFISISIDNETCDKLFNETMAELEEVKWQS